MQHQYRPSPQLKLSVFPQARSFTPATVKVASDHLEQLLRDHCSRILGNNGKSCFSETPGSHKHLQTIVTSPF
jgi:hypothetical protein